MANLFRMETGGMQLANLHPVCYVMISDSEGDLAVYGTLKILVSGSEGSATAWSGIARVDCSG